MKRHARNHIYTPINACIQAYTCASSHKEIHARAHTHIRTPTHANIHAHKHTRKHTNTCTYIQTYSHTHIRVRAHTHTHTPQTHNVLSRSEARVCGTTCQTMSRRLDPSSCVSRSLKRSNLVNLSKYRLFLNFVTVPSTLFDLFVVKNGFKYSTSSHNTPVSTCTQRVERCEK